MGDSWRQEETKETEGTLETNGFTQDSGKEQWETVGDRRRLMRLRGPWKPMDSHKIVEENRGDSWRQEETKETEGTMETNGFTQDSDIEQWETVGDRRRLRRLRRPWRPMDIHAKFKCIY